MGIHLAAILNVWEDSVEFIAPFIANTMKYCDGIIIIASTKSNYGEIGGDYLPAIDAIVKLYANIDIEFYTPALHHPSHSETAKRNYGLHLARQRGYTHFLMCDTDEFYEPEAFLKEKQRFIDNPNLVGLVCATQVYVKSPTLTIGLDTTLVPFIHKITPGLKHEFNRSYPYAWEGRNIRIDPTRSLSINSGVEWSHIVMDHYSWVRSDIDRKIRNSTAKVNIEKTNIRTNFCHLTEGSICEIYPGKPLVRVPNKYALPEFDVVQDLQRNTKPLATGGSAGQ